TLEYRKETTKTYSENNWKVVRGEKPELFEKLLQKIKDNNPDVICFSVVYSSQAFYTLALLKELKDYKTVIGGPAVNEKLINEATTFLKNEKELLDFVGNKKEEIVEKVSLDFKIFNLNEYFCPSPVLPLKTSTTCFYQKCAYCSHYSGCKYEEYDLDSIEETIKKSGAKHFFLMDEMIPVPRLLKLAELFKRLNVYWTCQLKPIKLMTKDVLKRLYDSGMTQIMWGVESANNRVLKLMNKGTNVEDVAEVLKNSHEVGIKNIVYIIFGFPTETKEELLETIDFMVKNSEHIDLVSTSIFGLHSGTPIYKNPEKFGISKIIEEKRTVLDPKITYEVSEGLTQEEASKIRQGYKLTLDKINKYPKTMNFFREHMFYIIRK
ncbi:radical SAM protein, partial [Candidatus Woesearchaeota archaeon]|nr:radical SAM protein [Candidatus Woesearchaeota archaeon]